MISDFPTGHEVKDKHDEGDDEEEMNESTGDMKREPTAPKEQQENGNDEEHTVRTKPAAAMAVPGGSYFLISQRWP